MNVCVFFQVLRKLAKKHGLTKEKREKTAMYVEDLVGVLQTNLTTTKQRHTHGWHVYNSLSSTTWLPSLEIDLQHS